MYLERAFGYRWTPVKALANSGCSPLARRFRTAFIERNPIFAEHPPVKKQNTISSQRSSLVPRFQTASNSERRVRMSCRRSACEAIIFSIVTGFFSFFTRYFLVNSIRALTLCQRISLTANRSQTFSEIETSTDVLSHVPLNTGKIPQNGILCKIIRLIRHRL